MLYYWGRSLPLQLHDHWQRHSPGTPRCESWAHTGRAGREAGKGHIVEYEAMSSGGGGGHRAESGGRLQTHAHRCGAPGLSACLAVAPGICLSPWRPMLSYCGLWEERGRGSRGGRHGCSTLSVAPGGIVMSSPLAGLRGLAGGCRCVELVLTSRSCGSRTRRCCPRAGRPSSS